MSSERFLCHIQGVRARTDDRHLAVVLSGILAMSSWPERKHQVFLLEQQLQVLQNGTS